MHPLAFFLVFMATAFMYPVTTAQSTNTIKPSAASIATGQSSLQDSDFVLPTVLSSKDLQTYSLIFALQENGKWKEADGLIKKLKDPILIGEVQFQRYMHPTKYRSSFKELRNWLKQYGDHPGAKRVHRLALKRKPKNYKNPARPSIPYIPNSLKNTAGSIKLSQRSSGKPKPYVVSRTANRLLRQYRRDIEKSYVSRSLKHALINRKTLGQCGFQKALGYIARGYYHHQFDEKAIALTKHLQASQDPTICTANLGWWAGLSAWRLERYESAVELFKTALSSWEIKDNDARLAQLNFWIWRAYLAASNPQNATSYLKTAASGPLKHTFYSVLANEVLGIDLQYNWQTTSYSQQVDREFRQTELIRRATALVELGRHNRANKTVKPVINLLSDNAKIWLVHFTEEAGLAELAYDLGRYIAKSSGVWVDNALYPIPGWASDIEFRLPSSLIFAIIRKESAFRATAISQSGARGLMQLMPATANFISNQRFRKRSSRSQLFKHELNIHLGQKYLIHLIEQDHIKENLVKALISYNAGPGNMLKWNRPVQKFNDPLLLVESLKALETRRYVKDVLSNSWIYADRLNQHATSLTELAKGNWPKLQTLEDNLASTPIDHNALGINAHSAKQLFQTFTNTIIGAITNITNPSITNTGITNTGITQ